MQLTDKSPMPYGKYGPGGDDPRTMANVPAQYLLWLYENNKCSGPVLQYIVANKDVLEAEAKS